MRRLREPEAVEAPRRGTMAPENELDLPRFMVKIN